VTLTDTVATRQQRRPLHEGWTLELIDGTAPTGFPAAPVAATVPGSVHTDLLAAGAIPDPYLDDNEAVTAWIGRASWRYRLTFDWTDQSFERVDLTFDGLDTIATITLNGAAVAETRNMHRRYRFPVRDLLREGRNELVVTFASPVRAADAASLDLGYRPHVNHHPYNSIRKMACSFGWDWGIDTASSGMWRPVTLHSWSGARLASVRPLARLDGDDGRLEAHVEVERASAAGELTVVVTCGEKSVHAVVPAGQDAVVATVELGEVRRWWPVGHGDQELYASDVVLGDEAGPLDGWVGRVGFRDIRIDSTPDEHGTPFTVVVNGRPIFIKGSNWIPDDAFPHRVDRARYSARLDQALGARMNLLRVWGGGIYEDDAFYELCDERGILVWQDFLFACAAYSEDAPMHEEVEAEARDNVARLSSHPSLALWNGNNENIWGFRDWGWERRLEGKTWGLGYYLELLPAIVAELDPDRAYTPGSPWSFSMDRHPNDPEHGSIHEWEVWNRQDYPAYRDAIPRFIAEFGWQGPPTWSTLTRALSDDPLTPESPGMLVHQKAQEGNDKLTDGLVPHLPFPATMADWHWAMQLNQARAVAFGIEHYRSWSPRTGGTVVWQLNDCWPVTSWAAVDGDGRVKPLWHALRSAYADRLVTIQPRDGGLAAVLVNDSDEEWSGELVVRRVAFDGVDLATQSVDADVAPRSTASYAIASAVAEAGTPERELISAAVGGIRGIWPFTEDRDAALAAADVAIDARADGDDTIVTVTARNYVRSLTVLADRLSPDAWADEGLITLLPGDSATIRLHGVVADSTAVSRSDVLRTANELVTGR
jgi:beta-mannosidase